MPRDLFAELDSPTANKSTPRDLFAEPNKPSLQEMQVSKARTVLDQTLGGMTANFADEPMDYVGAIVAKGSDLFKSDKDKLFADKSLTDVYKEARSTTSERLQRELDQHPLLSIGSQIGGAVLTGAAGATTKTGQAIGNSLRSGNLISRIGKGVVTGATSGGLYGAGAAEDNQRAEGAKRGAISGGIVGGAAPVIGATFGAVKNTVLPKVADPETAALAEKAIAEGIPVRRSQIGDSRIAKVVASTSKSIPFSGAKGFADKQQAAFNKAVLSKADIVAEKATPDVLQAANNVFNKKFTDAIANTKVMVDDGLLNTFASIEEEAVKRLGTNDQKLVRSYIDDLLKSGGEIDGQVYQNTRSALGKMAKSKMQSDPFVGGLLKDMQSALDEAAYKSLPNDGKMQWDLIRKQYGAYKTIQKAMNSTSADASIGNISPAALANAAKAGNPNYARGAGELNDLARIGSAFVKDNIPNSGTAERLSAYGGVIGLPGAIVAGTPGAVTGLASGIGAARAFNALDTSPRIVAGALKATKHISPSIALPTAGITNTIPNIDKNTNQPLRINITPEANKIKLAPLPDKQSMSIQGSSDQDILEGSKLLDTLQNPELKHKGKKVVGYISEAARIANVPPKYMLKKAIIESGLNPNAAAKTSSAKGLYQFTDGTWKDMVQRYGKQYGIKEKDILDPRKNAIMAGLFTKENKVKLENSLDRKIKDTDLYLAHFLGAEGAVKLLNSEKTYMPADRLLPNAAKANKAIFYNEKGSPRTPLGVIKLIERKLAKA